MQSPLIEFENVDLGYGRKAVLQNVSLTIEQGCFFGIVGPNGTGKTTLLKAILGMLKPLKGSVHRSRNFRFGYVPQHQTIDEVYPLTVAEVVLMGRYGMLGVFSRPSADDKRCVMKCLEHVGIADLASRQYRELSGGQKQRTLIARALSAEPDVLILDEPTNDMDIASEYAIMELLKHLNAVDGKSIVMVSHLLNVIANYAETLALINGGLRTVGKVETVLSTENLSSVYGVVVDVFTYGSKRVVIPGGSDV